IMYISKPWAGITYSLLVPESYRPGSPIPALAVNGPHSSDIRTARKFFPKSQLRPAATLMEVIQAVCSGVTDAALISVNAINSSPRMNCDQQRLRVLPIEQATYWFGVGAQLENREARAAADRLRDAIGELAASGELVSVDFRWNARLASEATTVFAYQNTLRYQWVFLGAFGVLTVALGHTLWLVRRLGAAQRQAEAA